MTDLVIVLALTAGALLGGLLMWWMDWPGSRR